MFAQEELFYSSEQLPVGIRILVGTAALAFYLLKIMLPFNLSPLYPYPNGIYLFDPKYIGSLLLLAAIIFFCIRSVKDTRLYLSICVYYLVTLFPVIGIIQVGQQFAADRYTYLPSIGLFLLGGLGVSVLVERDPRKGYRMLILTILLALMVILAFKSLKQMKVWRDSVTLWSYEIGLFPDVAIAHYNRGRANVAEGAYKQAVADLGKAAELNPNHAGTRYFLGVVYNRLMMPDEAERELQSAIRIKPEEAAFHGDLANSYYKQGRYDEAISAYHAAVRLEPDNPTYHNDIANTYYKQGRFDEAVREYESAIKLKPDFVYAHYNLGKVYMDKGLKADARREFETALKLRPDFLPARQELEAISD